jgi:hypothetical protein
VLDSLYNATLDCLRKYGNVQGAGYLEFQLDACILRCLSCGHPLCNISNKMLEAQHTYDLEVYRDTNLPGMPKGIPA